MTLASDANAIVRAALAAVDPARAVAAALRSPTRSRAARSGADRAVHVVALGKAAAGMTDGARAALGARFAGGIVALREDQPAPRARVEVLRGEHPVPGAGSERAGRRLLAYVTALPRGSELLFLISGGGSAIADVPALGISAADLASTTEVLLRSGAPIQAMNTVRRHLSGLKGGRLATAARVRPIRTLAISDVVGDAPWDIASGPTVGDPTTFAEALGAADRYGFRDLLPGRVRSYLEEGARGQRPETPKPGDARLAGTAFELVASNRTALAAAAREAERRGYRAEVLSSRVIGETRDIGRLHGEILAEAARRRVPAAPPRCFLSAGETTVTLRGVAGRGGRNQEFALAAAASLAGLEEVRLVSVGTDGVDGRTDAAGGWVDGATVARAARRGVDLDRALDGHASYDALRAVGGLVRTGPTGTNVMDLHVGLVGRAVTRRGRGGSSSPRAAPSSRRRRS